MSLTALAISAIVPSSVLADCCCRTGKETSLPGCCAAKQGTVPTSYCCTAPPALVCAESIQCDCSDCGCSDCECTIQPAPLIPRGDDGARWEVSLWALPAQRLAAHDLTVVVSTRMLSSADYVAPPVRERFCVWII